MAPASTPRGLIRLRQARLLAPRRHGSSVGRPCPPPRQWRSPCSSSAGTTVGGLVIGRVPTLSPVACLQADNEPRVRHGYISLGTREHARVRPTRLKSSICRENMIAGARACPPLPCVNLHGKEGIDGSSPSEGSAQALQIGIFVVFPDAAPAARGYETGTFWTRGALAGTRDPTRPPSRRAIAALGAGNPCKRVVDFGSSGAVVPTSFAREGVSGHCGVPSPDRRAVTLQGRGDPSPVAPVSEVPGTGPLCCPPRRNFSFRGPIVVYDLEEEAPPHIPHEVAEPIASGIPATGAAARARRGNFERWVYGARPSRLIAQGRARV